MITKNEKLLNAIFQNEEVAPNSLNFSLGLDDYVVSVSIRKKKGKTCRCNLDGCEKSKNCGGNHEKKI